MADVVITMKIMPDSPEVDLKSVEEKALEKITKFAELSNYKVELEPVAFGLKAINILFVMDEAKGATDSLEEDVAKIEGVNSVEITDVRRALG
jgi:elongation factor 1-beta